MNSLVISDTKFELGKRNKSARAVLDRKGGSVTLIAYKGFKDTDTSKNFILKESKYKRFVYEKELDTNGRLKTRFDGVSIKGERFEWLVEAKEASNIYNTDEVDNLIIIKKVVRPNYITFNRNLGEFGEDTFYTKGYLIAFIDVSKLNEKEKEEMIKSCEKKLNKFTLGGGGNYYSGEDFYYSDSFTKKEIEDFKSGGVLKDAGIKTLKSQVHLIYKNNNKNLVNIKAIERGYRGGSSFIEITPEPNKKISYSVYRSPRGNLGIYEGLVLEYDKKVNKIKAINKASGRLYGANPETVITIDIDANRYCDSDVDEEEIKEQLKELENENKDN